VAVAAILNPVLKNAFQVPRPEGEHLVKASGWGFPSGHAMSAAAFFLVAAIGLMVVVKSRLARAAIAAGAAVCVILIGISRIYLGVHSLVDVIAGWGAGLAVGFATIAAAQLLRSWALRQLKPH
jgi:undecaprenyl-diphosphatase